MNELLTQSFRIGEFQKKALKKLGVNTVRDLLYHFPTRYGDTSETKNIAGLEAGETATIFGKISGLKTSKGFRTKIAMADGYIEDETGRIHAVWFNQPYLAKMIAEDALVRVEGRVSQRRKEGGELYFSNPKIEVVGKLPTGVGDSLFGKDGEAHTLYPIYKESRGITSNWIYHKIVEIFKTGILEQVVDPIPDEILKKYSLPDLKSALIWIHTPMKKNDADAARKRFAFEEVFFIQLRNEQSRQEYDKNPSFNIAPNENFMEEFIKRFPFNATDAQRKAICAILADFKSGHAMSRLLEGDVGSGKTAVAASTAYAVVTSKLEKMPEKIQTKSTNNNSNSQILKPSQKVALQGLGHLQVAYMCPTEILATQHFESFIKYFSYLGISIGLITGSGARKFPSKVDPKGYTAISKSQLLKWVENGEIPILIGTHSLIEKKVKFKNLAYAIIDEQHRFGTKTRMALVRKDETGLKKAPHLLSMTATPIPRTLALTIYGDLDLTLLDQMPEGRKAVKTEIVRPDKRADVYEKIRDKIREGRQVYVICPRINEPDPDKEMALNVKSVKEEAVRLQNKIFPEYRVGILHSRLKPVEKDNIMSDFKNGKINILCSTSLVEVGVNVPNATIIIIEGAERFGLAQLHQLRGRVLRSNHEAFCYVFSDSKSVNSASSKSPMIENKTNSRLKALIEAKNGFELAEYDLKLRGAGELYGLKQWGISDIAMEALKNIKMVEAARIEAKNMINEDADLKNYPYLAECVRNQSKDIHLE